MLKRQLGAIATELRRITTCRILGGGLQRAEELREARALWHVDLVKVRVRARVRVRVRVRMTLNLALSLTARRTPAAKVRRLRATLWPVRVVHVQRVHLVVPRGPPSEQ